MFPKIKKRIKGFILEEEGKIGTNYIVDVTLETDFSEAAKTILNASADISLITKQNSALGYFLLLSMSFFMTISVVSVIFGFLKEKNNKEEYVK